MSIKLALPALALITALATAGLTPSPADACRQHDAGLPASASTEGALADFLVATDPMNRRQRRDHMATLSEETRRQIRDEIAALPKEEREALAKALRMNPNKLRLRPEAAKPQ